MNTLPHATDAALRDQIEAVYVCYRALEPGSGLGGAFLFAGELTEKSDPMLRAASIAGAASLAASADQENCKKALRDGAVDFLVNSLDEALRILKNEIRKRQPAAIAVSRPIEEIAADLLERAVQPELLFSDPAHSAVLTASFEQFTKFGARPLQPAVLPVSEAFYLWPLAAGWLRPAAGLEVHLATLLPELAEQERRWLRLSPRYLGAKARRLRSLGCDETTAARLGAFFSIAPSAS
ncbi:hypothetical protein ACOBR2_17790 [Telmatobacter bradus]|uniref:hypothetical protein n=1 Tax=Telmatobacter bradus TaxID=474953 RepID=UPI003B432D75